MCHHNPPQSSLHYSEIIPGNKVLYSESNKTNGNKIGSQLLQLMANSRTPGEFKNCKLENPSLLLGPLAQYLGSNKRRVLSPVSHIIVASSLVLLKLSQSSSALGSLTGFCHRLYSLRKCQKHLSKQFLL